MFPPQDLMLHPSKIMKMMQGRESRWSKYQINNNSRNICIKIFRKLCSLQINICKKNLWWLDPPVSGQFTPILNLVWYLWMGVLISVILLIILKLILSKIQLMEFLFKLVNKMVFLILLKVKLVTLDVLAMC